MFKKIAKLEFKKIYASDNNGNYYWRDFVKQANTQLATDSNFVPKNFYEYNTDKFLYLTARAISSLESWGPNGNFDAFPWEELKKSYPTFCGKGFYIEHKEDDENDAKGIILDAQPDEDNEFINCICAISKEEYPEICDDILNGRLNQVSMSCLAAECECLTPGTHILTPEGQTKIQDIKVGDYVLTHKGRFRKVLKTFKNSMPEYTYKIYFESGREKEVVNDKNRYNGTWIRATGNHPIYMADGTWVNAEDVKVGDELKCLSKKCPVCGKPIVYSKAQKYCSASCQSKDITSRPEVIQKQVASYKNTVINRTLEEKQQLHENLSKGQEKFKNSLSYDRRKKEMSLKGSKTMKQHFKDGTLDKEKERRKQWLKEKWKNPEYREKLILNSQNTMRKLAHKKRSYLEEKFDNFLQYQGFIKGKDYKTNDFLYIEGLRAYPDFKFDDKKLIVEIDGEHWHNNPEAIKKDNYKNKIWKEAGWTIIRYTGKQVNNEFSKVANSFMNIYNNHAHNYTFDNFKVTKIEKIKTKSKSHHVYNLHVEEDESYIAENLVVHNCSECHNVATKEEELCEHMNPEHPHFCKGSLDSNGKPIYEINRNIVFTGLSGVAVPADKDAFIFDVKASKKSKTSIDKEYNKYLRAKKEYEYINSLLEKEDTRKYIESQLNKKAKRLGEEQSEQEALASLENSIEKAVNYYNDMLETVGNPEDEKFYKNCINLLQVIMPTIKNNEFYKFDNAIEVEAKLKKKADVEYFSDKVQEIPEIDFYTEFMNAGKSKGCNSDINKDQLELGIKVEMEHTTNPVIAEKIACDHIKEIPNYYTLLAEMEVSAKARFEEAKHVVNKETNEEFPTKLASKQFFKVKKAAGSGFANIVKFKTDKDFYDKIKQLRKNKNIEVIYKIIDGVGLYLLYKGNEHLGTLNTHELTYAFDTDISKQSSKQFFKVNKSSKKWFKIANIYDDPKERNNIDNYGLSELQRKELQNVINHIDIVNEDAVVTWDELVESVNQDILDYDFMNKNKVNIMDYIENELGQKIEAY